MISRLNKKYRRIRLKVASHWLSRLKGLLGRDRAIRGDLGLWISPCRAIHTVGMRFPIDVAFIDRKGKVRLLVRNMPPGRFAFCFRAVSVVELSINDTDTCLRYRRRIELAIHRQFVVKQAMSSHTYKK